MGGPNMSKQVLVPQNQVAVMIYGSRNQEILRNLQEVSRASLELASLTENLN